jgi:hypothetical protein
LHLALLLGTASACAALPHEAVTRGLYVDLRKAVELSADTGWVVDRVQLDGNADSAMQSLCQVAPASRQQLEAWLGARIAAQGGSAEQVYERHGRDMNAISELLALERTRMLLRYAQARADEDCPFWLRPDRAFKGVQGDADRLILLAETRGFGAVVLQDGEGAIGGGGAGRLLVGHGVNPQLTLAIGGEVGGTGAFVAQPNGSRNLETRFTAALPLLLRISRFSRLIDFEAAPVVRLVGDGDSLTPGARFSIGFGISAMRSSVFMPYGLVWLGYEHHLASDGSSSDDAVQIGTRVGVDWDP